MKTRLALALLALTLVAVPAHAMNWGIGADLGYNLFMPSSDYDMDGNYSVIGIPSGNSMSAIPNLGGLRVSFAGQNPMHEVWLGTSLGRLSYGDNSFSTLQLSGNYQLNIPVQSAVKPYVTAGVGLYHVGYDYGKAYGGTSAFFGGGVGAAHAMGSGRVRGEVRFDAVTEGKDGDYVVVPKGGIFGFKLGFDLWAK